MTISLTDLADDRALSLIDGNTKLDHLPRWFDNEEIRERVEQVYNEFMDKIKVATIAARYNISPGQVYGDVKRMREILAITMARNAELILAEQIEAQRRIVQKCEESRQALHLGIIKPSQIRRILRDETEVDIPEDLGLSPMTTYDARMGEADAKILEVMQRAEAEINRLYGLGNKGGINININSGNEPAEKRESVAVDVSAIMTGGRYAT